MNTDPNEIQKLTERVEALEKFKEETRSRYILFMIGSAVLIIYLFVIADSLKH